ncbi:MAG: CDP-alcohol phosphatidyltransferase family protein [Kiritimatiellae bacterium]|nr:CDP-alcohol phosphatidyltransferase family protein [Kiritimatiellia bacterium]
MKQFINWRQAIPTLCTIAAMLAGFISILVAIEGMQAMQGMQAADPERCRQMFRLSAMLIMLSMILDGLDGNLARWLKGTSTFGAELDTYVDLTAFGIAPAILIFAVALQQKDPMWRLLLPSAVALSGMVRLARFKVKDPLRGQGGYAGLPITANAGWVSLFVFISQTPPLPNASRDIFSLQEGWFATMFLMGTVSFILLQVSNFRYPKPTKKPILFAPCVVLVVLLFAPKQWLSISAAFTSIILGVVYIFLGPLMVKGAEAHKAWKENRINDIDGSPPE